MSFRKQRAARNLRESHNFLGIILFIPEEELHELNLFRFSGSEQIQGRCIQGGRGTITKSDVRNKAMRKTGSGTSLEIQGERRLETSKN